MFLIDIYVPYVSYVLMSKKVILLLCLKKILCPKKLFCSWTSQAAKPSPTTIQPPFAPMGAPNLPQSIFPR